MSECKLCETKCLSESVCFDCGFNNESDKIDDPEKLQIYHRKLIKEDPWHKEVALIYRLHKIYGNAIRKYKKYIKLEKVAIHNAVKLAKALEEHQELIECKNKTQALNRLKEINSQLIKVRSLPKEEIEIQIYLYDNWNKIPFTKKWDIFKGDGSQNYGQYSTDNCGTIDLLAKGKNGNDWIVVELKRDKGNDKTLGQLLRYMGWVKTNLSNEKDVVYGLIIASSIDEQLELALTCVQNISCLVHRKRDGKWEFTEPEEAILKDFLLSLTPEERIKLNLTKQ